jgi:hypothetical protein
MKVEHVFNRKIIRFQCDEVEFYTNENFLHNLNRLFNHPAMRDTVSNEQVGDAQTTVGKNFLLPLKLPGAENLERWIHERLMEAAPHFVDFTPTSIQFVRTWTNKMFRGCEGQTHNHRGPNHGVGVFYVNIPENGSDLVFVRDGVYMTKISDYAIGDVVFAGTRTGELVLHDTEISHAVSEHDNDEPRICIVVEFTYIP